MRSVVQVARAIARNRPLARVVLAYAVFSGTQNAAWIGMLVYAYARGGAATASAVAVVQLVPAALVAPLAAGLADRRAPSRVLPAKTRLLRCARQGRLALDVEPDRHLHGPGL